MRGAYSTRQKRELLRFLQERSMQHFSVDEVVFEMQDKGEKIGRTTVYRYLEQLADQGSVRKYQTVQGVTQYQHISDDAHCREHFHMMCKRCGNLLHVDCDLMRTMQAHLMEDHGFALDPMETILVGICRECQDREEGGSGHGADIAEGRDRHL